MISSGARDTAGSVQEGAWTLPCGGVQKQILIAMLCLGVESSCDECSLALVKDGRLIAQVLSSQIDLHALFGGVVPELASREHYRHMGPLFDLLFQRSAYNPGDLELIAVTRGPGLLGSLLVGTGFAKALALGLGVPVLGINHLQAHLLACGLERDLIYPAMGLLVSGGHTRLYLIEAPDQFTLLGRSLDDAAGEAYDKIGQLLDLPYPAGKKIDLLAARGDPSAFSLPRPYLDNPSLDFSFSGLKTAAALVIKNNPSIADKSSPDHPFALANFCAALNQAVSGALAHKLEAALTRHPECRAVWLSGGVAANTAVRKKAADLTRERGLSFLAPSPALCADNAAMIAMAGCLLGEMGYRHNLDFETFPRGRAIPDDMLRNRL